MDDREKEEILKVLQIAVMRETEAFNFYYRKSEDETFPLSVRGLLVRLAEEERRHRHMLLDEYLAIDKRWRLEGEKGAGGELSYMPPEEVSFLSVEFASNLEGAAVCLPSQFVGGDSIFSSIVRDRVGSELGTFMYLYDVMGHSTETTDLSGFASRIFGEYMESAGLARMEKESLSPMQVVKLINERFSERFKGKGIFLTMFCVYFDAHENILTYTCAGHEPPFLIDRDGRQISLIDTQLIVGIVPEYPYREFVVPFEPGSMLCVFSDGAVEATNGEGEMLSRSGIAEILGRYYTRSPEEIIVCFLEELKEHCAGEPMRDELSILVVKARER